MGKASYMMRQFSDARHYFESCLKLNKNNQEASRELTRSNNRLAECSTGTYDFESIVKQHLKKENLDIDVADFHSSKLSVVDIPNKSKGVVANESIKKGTLLAVSKAVSVIFNNTEAADRSDLNYGSRNFVNTIYKMQSNPQLAEQVYSLFAGPQYDRNEKADEFFIDIDRIDQIQKFNSFSMENHFESINGKQTDLKGLGLWVFTSLFNHSCVENAHRVFFGDLFVLYAKRDIEKNEEVTVKYFDGTESYSKRVDTALVRGFKCDCSLCRFDAADDSLLSRESLVDELILKRKQLALISLREAEEDVKLMRLVYSNRNYRRTGLVFALQHLAMKHRLNRDFKMSAEIFEEIYEISKEDCELVAIFSLRQAYEDYKCCSIYDKCEWCYTKAAEYYSNNDAFFKRLWNEIIVE